MEQLPPPPQEKELPAPHEKLLRSPTLWEKQGKAAKWLAIGSIIFFVVLLASTLLLRLLKPTTTPPIQPPISTTPTITSIPQNAIEISADKKSILNARTNEVIFTISDTQKYLKNSGYEYNPDTFQTTNAKYAGECFGDAALSNKEDRIVFSTGCLPGDLPQPWIGIYYFPYKCPPNAKCIMLKIADVPRFLIGGGGKNFVWSTNEATITYEADLGLSGLTETRTIDSNTGEILEKKNSTTSNPITSNLKTYRNEKYGFEITFPNKDWYLPTASDNDPHFYATKECANSERPNCSALEIQNHDNDSEFSKGWEARINTLKIEGGNPIKLTSLIPKAIVIKSNAPGTAEGWSTQYDIFFQTGKKNFLIFSNNEALEKDIIPTFKLLNQTPN